MQARVGIQAMVWVVVRGFVLQCVHLRGLNTGRGGAVGVRVRVADMEATKLLRRLRSLHLRLS